VATWEVLYAAQGTRAVPRFVRRWSTLVDKRMVRSVRVPAGEIVGRYERICV
jgi:hypothetical protein